MKKPLKNRYFLLRHGKNIHQTIKKDIFYHYPDDNPPCHLIDEGVEQAKDAGIYLKNKNIDLIISSDILRAKETADIVSEEIGYGKEIRLEKRLRDINWGIFGGKTIKEGWDFYNNDTKKRFSIAPENGETWNNCKERIVEVLGELEAKFNKKNILIVSHGDPLWLLEGYVCEKNEDELACERKGKIIAPGEIREL